MPRKSTIPRKSSKRRQTTRRAKPLTRARTRSQPSRTRWRRTRFAPLESDRLETAVKSMNEGKSLTATARGIGVSPYRLRRSLKSSGLIRKRRKRWFLRTDAVREMLLFSGRQPLKIIVARQKNISAVGRYMNAVRALLTSNEPVKLSAFVGKSVRDISGKRYRYETDPNTLYRLASTGSETFEDIYRFVI